MAALSFRMDYGGGPPHRRKSWIQRHMERLRRPGHERPAGENPNAGLDPGAIGEGPGATPPGGWPTGNVRVDPRWQCATPVISRDAEGVAGENTVVENRKSRRRAIGAAERGGWGYRWMFNLMRRHRLVTTAAVVGTAVALILPHAAIQFARPDLPEHLVMLIDPSPPHARAGLVADLDGATADLVARNGVEVGPDGRVTTPGNQLATAATGAGRLLPVYPLVTPTENVQALLNDAAARRRAVHELARLAVAVDYAGLNLDIGPIPAELADGFRELTNALARRLHRSGRALQVTVYPDGAAQAAWISGGADMVVLAAHRPDLFSWTPGPIAPMDWVTSQVEQVMTAVPAEKIVLQMAAYGRRWSDSAGPTERLTLREIAELERRYGPPTVTPDGAYLHYREGGSTYHVWYENGESAAAKARLARDLGLRGVAVWRPGADHAAYWAPVLDVMKGRR